MTRGLLVARIVGCALLVPCFLFGLLLFIQGLSDLFDPCTTWDAGDEGTHTADPSGPCSGGSIVHESKLQFMAITGLISAALTGGPVLGAFAIWLRHVPLLVGAIVVLVAVAFPLLLGFSGFIPLGTLIVLIVAYLTTEAPKRTLEPPPVPPVS